MNDENKILFEKAITEVAISYNYKYMDTLLNIGVDGHYEQKWVDSAFIGWNALKTSILKSAEYAISVRENRQEVAAYSVDKRSAYRSGYDDAVKEMLGHLISRDEIDAVFAGADSCC